MFAAGEFDHCKVIIMQKLEKDLDYVFAKENKKRMNEYTVAKVRKSHISLGISTQ